MISPDSTESSADGEERCSNRSSSPIEKVCQTSSSEFLVSITNTTTDQGNTDDDGGEEIGELEIELEPWLTGGLYCTRHTKVKKGNIRISMTHYTYQSVLSCSSISCLILCFSFSNFFSSRSLKDDLISFVNSYFSLKLKTLETIVMGIFSGFWHL